MENVRKRKKHDARMMLSLLPPTERGREGEGEKERATSLQKRCAIGARRCVTGTTEIHPHCERQHRTNSEDTSRQYEVPVIRSISNIIRYRTNRDSPEMAQRRLDDRYNYARQHKCEQRSTPNHQRTRETYNWSTASDGAESPATTERPRAEERLIQQSTTAQQHMIQLARIDRGRQAKSRAAQRIT